MVREGDSVVVVVVGGGGGGGKNDFCQLNNQLVEKIIPYKQTDNGDMVRENASVWGMRV